MALPTWFVRTVELALAISFFLVVLKIVYSLWIWPNMVYKKLRRNGLIGPSPSFPLGNIKHMVAAKNKRASALSSCTTVSHDIYSKVVPHFAEWQESHGKNMIIFRDKKRLCALNIYHNKFWKMLGAYNHVQNFIHNDMWWILIEMSLLYLHLTTPIK